MTPKRPKQLRWIGAMLPDGRPAQHLESYGLPSRDLTPDETDALDQEQIALARKHPDLFKVIEQPEPKKTAKRAQKPVDEPEPDTSTDETSGAETPATDGDNAAESEA